jgi:CRP/FNR family transcriptional regulator, cyclic AMP receptor protein
MTSVSDDAHTFAAGSLTSFPQYRSTMAMTDKVENQIVVALGDQELFGDLPASQVAALEAMQLPSVAPARSTLFTEGEAPFGVFVLYSGTVELSVSSPGSRRLVLQVAEPGHVLGLTATVSGKPYSVTATTVTPANIGFLKRDEFLDFLHAHSEAAFRVAQMLSINLNRTFEQVRSLRRRRASKVRD